MAILSTLSDDLAVIVASVAHGVVQVERRGGSASGTAWTAEGFIVTANHVLRQDDDLQVGLADGKVAEAKLVGRDPTTDLALLRVNSRFDAPPEWAATDSLRVGHLVLALARPGKTVRAGFGIVGAMGETWRTPAGGTIARYLQSDAPGYPGFSGGPLVTVNGTVAGINTSGLIRNVTVAIPTETVKSVVDELLKRGRIARGYLGVGIQPARLPPAIALQLAQETGLLIMSVEPGSPGDRAGLVLGDTILSVGGKPVRHWDDLLAVLAKDQIGVTVSVRILRAGQMQDVKATIAERD